MKHSITTLWATITAVLLLTATAPAQTVSNDKPLTIAMIKQGKELTVNLPMSEVFRLIKKDISVNTPLETVNEQTGLLISYAKIDKTKGMRGKKEVPAEMRSIIVVQVLERDGKTVVKLARLAQVRSIAEGNFVTKRVYGNFVGPFGDTFVEETGTNYLVSYYGGEKSPFAKAVVKDSNAQTTAPPTPKPKPEK